MNWFSDYHHFYGMCFDMRNRKIAKEVYIKLPLKVKKVINKNFIHVCDSVARYKDPTKKFDKQPIGFYHVGKGIIDIIPQNPPLSDKALTGLIVHETAHGYVDNTLCLLQKLYFKIKFNRLTSEQKNRYPEYQELHANWLACKWGFGEDILALEKERTII
ncbi:MAG: hypothetical protein AABX12_00320 [Nanoarchaeota archaeon]